MEWRECNCVADLKKLGKFYDVKKKIQTDLPKNVRITAQSWDALYTGIYSIRVLFGGQSYCHAAADGFVSEKEKYLFCLTKLDGANRQDLLDVSRVHYSDHQVASKWYKKIAQKIHPDKANDPRAELAFKNLDRMYSEMAK